MKTENPIILNTGGIGAVSIDMTHTNCACKLICDCEDENSKPLKIIIEFSLVTAYRFTCKMYCGGFPDGSYDAILEVKDSDWLKTVCANAPRGHKSPWRQRHFAMFLGSCGCYEFIADDVTVKNEYYNGKWNAAVYKNRGVIHVRHVWNDNSD